MPFAKITGPRVPPLKGEAKQLVVLAHGYRADGNDLIGLAPHWQKILPHAAFVAPNAPRRCAAGPGYEWFPITRLDPAEMARGVEEAAPVLDAFLEEELTRYGLPPEKAVLVGFSQGTMLSLAVGLSRAKPPAAILGYSGLLAGAVPEGGSPPVMLIHGTADPMIPAEALFMSAAALGAAGVCVQWHLCPGLGHGIDEAGLELGGQFLALALAGRLKPASGAISSPLR